MDLPSSHQGDHFSHFGCRTRSPYGFVREDATDQVDRGGQSLDLKLTFLTDGDQQAPQTVVRQTVWDDSNVGIALRGLADGLGEARIISAGYGRSIVLRSLSARMGLASRPDNATLTGGVFFFNPRNLYLA